MKQLISFSAAVAAALLVAVSPSPARTQSLESMERETAKAYAELLSTRLKEFKDLQVKVEPDYEQSMGLATEGQGMLVVADKGLKEGDENPAAKSDPGDSIGISVFVQPIRPPQRR